MLLVAALIVTSTPAHRACLLVAGNLYPDPQLPSIARGDDRPQLVKRIARLESDLERSKSERTQTTTTGVKFRTASDTLSTFSLILWTMLGCMTAIRMRFGKPIPASIVLLFAVIGGGISLSTLIQDLILAMKRTMGLGPPKLRCYRCLTIFEVQSGSPNAACPQCGTVNKLVPKSSSSAFKKGFS